MFQTLMCAWLGDVIRDSVHNGYTICFETYIAWVVDEASRVAVGGGIHHVVVVDAEHVAANALWGLERDGWEQFMSFYWEQYGYNKERVSG